MSKPKQIKARFASRCPQCSAPVAAGDTLQKVENGGTGSAWYCPPCADLLAALWKTQNLLAFARHPWTSTVSAGVRTLDGRDFGKTGQVEQTAIVAELEAELADLQAQRGPRGWRLLPAEAAR